MFCTKCGFQIKDGYKFCPKCGTPAFVEKEEPKSKVDKEEIDEVTKEEKAEPTDVVVSTAKVKEANDTKAEIKSKKDADFIPHDDFIPNPLIEKELDIEGVKKKAEQGNEKAMLRQAFRYEVGIGVEKDIAKAKELYDNVGGMRTLPFLERSHNNSILPDPINDNALLPNSETNDDEDNVLWVIPFVKDIILDYSNKVEQEKLQGKLTKEKALDYRDEFIQRLKDIRELYPELLLVNIDEKETEDSLTKLFEAIKISTASRYSLKWIPSLYNCYDYIEGAKIVIPSIYEIKTNGLFTIKYNSEKEKNSLLNQFVLTLLIQLPIKKIRLNFVDLEGRYEYDNLLSQLHPYIYCDRPITSEEEFNILLNRLEERRLDVIKKYGDYSDYCEKNHEIPIPYEFIFFFNSAFSTKIEERLIRLYSSSYRIGVYYVIFENNSRSYMSYIIDGDVYNYDKNVLYTKSKRSYNRIIDSGICYNTQYENNKNYDIILKHSGISPLPVVKIVKDALHIELREAKEMVDNTPSILRVNIPISEAETMKSNLEKAGAICDIVDNRNKSLFDWTNFFSQNEYEHEVGYHIEGYGCYDVIIKLDYNNSNPNYMYNIEDLKTFTKKLDIYSENNSNKITKLFESHEGLLLKTFPTRDEANRFVENIDSIPMVSIKNCNRIRFVPYYVTKQKTERIGIALYIPHDSLQQKNIEQDLTIYLSKIGFSSSICQKVTDIIAKKTVVGLQVCYKFPDIRRKSHCVSIPEEKISFIKSEDYYGFLFPDFLNNKYEMDFGFWGYNSSSSKDIKTACEAIDKCINDISNVENELDRFAVIKWGKEYAKNHLAFKDEIDNIASLIISKTNRIGIPILMANSSPLSESIIKPFYLADENLFSQACINYINKQVDAKEETKVVSLSYDEYQTFYDDITNELLIDVGKKGKDEMQFRMDLVSHVHSFIIGQSGSGKSVFLHNIIGGAMLKYAPEDLQLYLLDFKLGGVEFNRYQGAKHVKALLVDNSDPQVTLEILRELRSSMTERGKLLRSAGVNNIGEFNKLHQQDRMPHVLVVADECHEMFKADDSIPRQVRNEISDIVIKIAKEGRSQGVHLVFATQTLSGTEISSEIINNVSDFYLLKCAQTDSERLVPNSSNITSELSTGQIYYHHVDEQVKFQAYYTDKEAAEKLMAAIVEKAKDHKSNGEFYFNGAQMFYLDEAVKEQMQAVKGKSPLAFMGKAIDISQKDLYIKLNEDFSENVLVLGLNDQEQVTRTTMNIFVSLMMSSKLKHKDIAFKVIDCLNNEEGEVHELIFDLENAGYCEIIERRQRSKFFKELAQGVQDGTAEETILLILGQDRFRELKNDLPLEDVDTDSKSSSSDPMMTINAFLDDDGSSSNDYKAESNIKTYREALNIILDKGPDYGVHTLLQLEKASNLLFEDYITPKVVFQKFKHLVMLKSDEAAGVTLHLNDEIRLEKLSSDWERLRGYYYAEESDSYTLFTPYMPSKSKDIINLLNTL